MPGRNDPCPCGSGKKYKQCCLKTNSVASVYSLIRTTVNENKQKELVADALCNMWRFIDENGWQGACHASCSVLYVVLTELGLSPKLCVGEVLSKYGYFSHLWIELEGKVIDLSAANPLEQSISGPIIFDQELPSMRQHQLTYGVQPKYGLDKDTQILLQMPFCDFMSGFPEHPNGLWHLAEIISPIKLSSLSTLKEKYKDTQRTLKL